MYDEQRAGQGTGQPLIHAPGQAASHISCVMALMSTAALEQPGAQRGRQQRALDGLMRSSALPRLHKAG